MRRRSPLDWLRKQVYKRGFRPTYGMLLYSPSLDMAYATQEAMRGSLFMADLKDHVENEKGEV